MIKTVITLLMLAGVGLTSSAAENTYNYTILHQADTTVKATLEGITAGSRDVRYYVYDYPSTDPDGHDVTISGIIMAPTNIVDGSVPCDGVIMFNHHTLGNPSQAPSQGGLDVPSGILANPLRPNYIIVMSDYIGYGSSIERPTAYLCGDTNARNSLDGLLAARQLFADHKIPQGKFLFNMGFSQGGTESMYAAKLCDMESKYKDIKFDKTFVGGGLLDTEKALEEYVRKDKCDDISDVAMFLIAVNENRHLGISYSDLFQEPYASNVAKAIKTKDKGDLGVSGLDSLHQLLKPAYMDAGSEPAKALIEKLKEIKIANGWKPDLTRQYFIEHSRHDNYVPVQCARSIISWMKEQGFTPSLVPGKTSLQTNMLVFKLNHQQSAIVWAIQTVAAVQFWPVVYYEGEQNRYYRNVVHDLNLMKVIKYLEGWGIDLRKLTQQSRQLRTDLADGVADGTLLPEGSPRQLSAVRRASFFEIIAKITDLLAKVDLTISDLYEMLEDSGITISDILEVVNYFTNTPDASRGVNLFTAGDDSTLAPVYLLKVYEQKLADWYQLSGFDVEYDRWGW